MNEISLSLSTVNSKARELLETILITTNNFLKKAVLFGNAYYVLLYFNLSIKLDN